MERRQKKGGEGVGGHNNLELGLKPYKFLADREYPNRLLTLESNAGSVQMEQGGWRSNKSKKHFFFVWVLLGGMEIDGARASRIAV